jgi:hypothetical protein
MEKTVWKVTMNKIDKLIYYCLFIFISQLFFIKTLFIIMKKNKYSPLILIQLYLLFSILLFYGGPLSYPKVNVAETLFLIILYNLFFIGGYIFALKNIVVRNRSSKHKFSFLRKIYVLGGIISIFFSLAYFIQYSNSFNILVILNDIKVGVTNPGEAYHKNIILEKESSIITQAMTLISPLTYLTIPVGLFLYKKLRLPERILLTLVIIFELSTFVIKGTNFGIFKMAIIFFVVFYINNQNKKLHSVVKIIISFAVIYFLYSISSRMNLTTIPESVFNIQINKDHFIFNLLPISLSIPLMLGSSYISQGYYGLSLATTYDFQTLYGFGSGRFLISKFQSFIDTNLWERTYQYQMDSLWDSRVNWHTIYVWFANDFGLYGVPFVMALIGFLFVLILKDAKENKSVIAVILLPLYLLMIIFIPANNIIFDNPLMFMPFVFFNMIWIFSKKWRVKV